MNELPHLKMRQEQQLQKWMTFVQVCQLDENYVCYKSLLFAKMDSNNTNLFSKYPSHQHQ